MLDSRGTISMHLTKIERGRDMTIHRGRSAFAAGASSLSGVSLASPLSSSKPANSCACVSRQLLTARNSTAQSVPCSASLLRTKQANAAAVLIEAH